MTSKKEWLRYLTECDRQRGDLVMYRHECGDVRLVNLISDSEDTAKMMSDDNETPIRIFTPDGKTQKGVDYVPMPSKREQVEELLYEQHKALAKGATIASIAITTDHILKICEVSDDD